MPNAEQKRVEVDSGFVQYLIAPLIVYMPSSLFQAFWSVSDPYSINWLKYINITLIAKMILFGMPYSSMISNIFISVHRVKRV